MAELRSVSLGTPAASKATRGLALTSVRRLRATQPERPWPTATVALSSRGASTPTAKRHFNVSSGCCRYSAQPDHGMIFVSLEEISAMVSDTPRLVPIDCAISYKA